MILFLNLLGMSADGLAVLESALAHAGTLSGAWAGTTWPFAMLFAFAGAQPIATAMEMAASAERFVLFVTGLTFRCHSGWSCCTGLHHL
jgi:hypothetical protein